VPTSDGHHSKHFTSHGGLAGNGAAAVRVALLGWGPVPDEAADAARGRAGATECACMRTPYINTATQDMADHQIMRRQTDEPRRTAHHSPVQLAIGGQVQTFGHECLSCALTPFACGCACLCTPGAASRLCTPAQRAPGKMARCCVGKRRQARLQEQG